MDELSNKSGNIGYRLVRKTYQSGKQKWGIISFSLSNGQYYSVGKQPQYFSNMTKEGIDYCASWGTKYMAMKRWKELEPWFND